MASRRPVRGRGRARHPSPPLRPLRHQGPPRSGVRRVRRAVQAPVLAGNGLSHRLQMPGPRLALSPGGGRPPLWEVREARGDRVLLDVEVQEERGRAVRNHHPLRGGYGTVVHPVHGTAGPGHRVVRGRDPRGVEVPEPPMEPGDRGTAAHLSRPGRPGSLWV